VNVTTTEILDARDALDRARVADALLGGGVVACAYNGIYTLLGDADDATVPARAAAAKGRPEAQGLALVCPPEHLGEHVALDAPVLRSAYPFDAVQELSRAVHAVGLILPAAVPGAPSHLVQAGTILNVWTEERPLSPLRELVRELRSRGRRALAGTSANRTGEPTITTSAEVVDVFSGRVDAILLDDFGHVAEARRRSASIVDLTAPIPRLVREGSVAADELAAELRRLGFGELQVAADVRRV
jgi:tRNA A37 threonylcarbamoyladenosine synthetase subunit TsaC/SUA5/YrdC